MTDVEASGSTVPEAPVVLDYVDKGDGCILYRFAFEGVPYEMLGPADKKDSFVSWLPDYAAKTPRCACCDRVIFPGQPVAVGAVQGKPDAGHTSHFSTSCNETAGGFAGSYNEAGELVSPWR